ncbi:t-SNARE [Anaeromyces robustus]|uniref:t-SNARE n=1 Tax=Anaeromyces robustus TaxID=1754192 RepID=A0A1Y1XNT0_9FUNG|nr:t-SNARE [Anaeromyces robustus]|eukprot:ORX86974.1 t-SNARE [Anaeromyces robustus]
MRVNDRTQEFHATVESMLSRRPFNETFGLLNRGKDKTQFYKIAMGIGKENENVNVKLKKLSELVQQNTLLDDKLPEITQMIQIIKVDISKMSTEINAFQNAFKDKKIPYVMNRHSLENANNIISSLQTKLLNTSNDFKDTLELRTQIMREQKARKDQYSSSGAALTNSNPSSVASSPHLFGSRIMSKIGTPLSRSHSSTPIPQDVSNNNNNINNNNNNNNLLNSPISSVRSNSPLSNQTDINPAASSIPMNTFTPPPQVIQSMAAGSNPSTSNTNTLSSTNNNNNLLNPFPISQPPNYYERKPNQGIAYSNSVNYGAGGGGPERRNVSGVNKGSDDLLVISVNNDDDDNGKGKSGSNYPYVQQQQQLYEPYSQSYLESRSSAIDSIEATIAELGQIYQNFTHILAGQRETVQRIDDNIMDVDMNVTGAQDYLMKYYKSISSNRWLIIKILLVVLIFFFIFVVFL